MLRKIGRKRLEKSRAGKLLELDGPVQDGVPAAHVRLFILIINIQVCRKNKDEDVV